MTWIITRARAAELLSYDPESGKFQWNANTGTSKAGQEAGCLDRTGYIRIGIDGQRYAAHRVAFLLMEGHLPKLHVDHINGCRSDNRWGNLRHASRTENNRNRCNRSDNTSGHPGVTWMPRNKKWRARINNGERRISLGLFTTIEQAVAARKAAETAAGYSPIHGREAA